MKTVILILIVLTFTAQLFSQESETIVLHPDLKLRKVTDNVYIHISYMPSEQYGRFPSNGLVYIIGDKCAVIDTPVSDTLSEQLIDWLDESLQVEVKTNFARRCKTRD